MQDVHWNVTLFPLAKKKLLITCHFPGLARREDIPGSPAGAAQTFLSSLTNVRRKTPKQGCGPLCDFPSITPSLPPFSYHLSLLWRLDLPQGAPLKLIRSITHLLIINRKDPRAQSCQEGGGDRSVGGILQNWHFSIFSEERWTWGRRADRETVRSGRQDSPATCHLKTNCCCPFTLPSEWLKKDWVCVTVQWLSSTNMFVLMRDTHLTTPNSY